jgi:hypothetical protein
VQDIPRFGGSDEAEEYLPIRAVARISYDYFLNILGPVTAELGDLLTTLSWMTVLHNNVGHLPELSLGAANGAEIGWSGDHQRKPAPVSSVAAQLGIPEATIRRRILQTIQAGCCRRVSGGIIVPDSALHRPAFIELMRINDASLSRMFYALHRVGALSSWDATLT